MSNRTNFADDNQVDTSNEYCVWCSHKIEFDGHQWRHVGLAQPRHPAMPKEAAKYWGSDDLTIDPGIVLEYHDAPGDEPETPETELREALAEYSHEAWSGWMVYMFERGGVRKEIEYENGRWVTVWIMAPEKYDRWQRQMSTPYATLSDAEKTSDRAEADKMMAIAASLSTTANVDALYKHLYAQLTPGQRTMLQALVILLRPEATDE